MKVATCFWLSVYNKIYFTEVHSLVYNIYCTDNIYKYLYTHQITIDVRNYVCLSYKAVRNVVLNLHSANY